MRAERGKFSDRERDKTMILHVGDRFDRIVDIMNQCFGRNYRACYKGWYALDREKGTSAWFPKIADLKDDSPQPGDRWYGWCNTMSSDGDFIYMNNFENPGLLDKDEPAHSEPHVTFAKKPGEKHYSYAGVYVRTIRDRELGWVYKRIAGTIDTADYM